MARRDGTGPLGQGPMTGRGMGPCAETSNTRASGIGTGRGLGYGYGRGLGYGRGAGAGRGTGRGAGLGYRCRGFFGWNRTGGKENLAQEKSLLQDRLNEINKELEQ